MKKHASLFHNPLSYRASQRLSAIILSAMFLLSSTALLAGGEGPKGHGRFYRISPAAKKRNAPANASKAPHSGAPTVSYASPQTYTAGSAIPTLLPGGSGVAAARYSSTANQISIGFSHPNSVAVDSQGNTYVADFGNNAVKEIPAAGGLPVALGSGFSGPSGVAVDAAGNVYVADYNNNAIKKIPQGTNSVITIASGLNGPVTVAIDLYNNIFFGQKGNSKLYKIPAAGGAPIQLSGGSLVMTQLAVDAYDNIYVTDAGNNFINEYPATGSQPITILAGLNTPTGIAVDPAGNIFFTESGDNVVKEIPAGGSAVTIASGFSNPTGITVAPSGDILVADNGNSLIKEIVPTGGYFLSALLPPGLNFNQNTGAISGTPISAASATNYTVTAYNASGYAQTGLNLSVTLPPLPSLSYNPLQSYAVNYSIPPLQPVAVNVAAPFAYSFFSQTYGSGVSQPSGICTDAAGDIL